MLVTFVNSPMAAMIGEFSIARRGYLIRYIVLLTSTTFRGIREQSLKREKRNFFARLGTMNTSS